MSAPQRRARIEKEAARLFAARGYETSSLDEIAEAAGISKRVIYDHFPSKRELHMALIESQTLQLWAFVADRVQAEDGSIELRTAAGAEAFFEFVETHPDAWRMLFRDPPSDDESLEQNRRLQSQTTTALATLLSADPAAQDAVAAALPRTVEMLAEMLKMSLHALASWWYDHPDVPREELVSALMGFAWLGMERLSEGGRWRDPRQFTAVRRGMAQ